MFSIVQPHLQIHRMMKALHALIASSFFPLTYLAAYVLSSSIRLSLDEKM